MGRAVLLRLLCRERVENWSLGLMQLRIAMLDGCRVTDVPGRSHYTLGERECQVQAVFGEQTDVLLK